MSPVPAYDLSRFLTAQENIYPRALAELRRGAKRGHWMWFIFPQIAGLGTSATSRHFAVRSPAEALAYLQDERLGVRLIECTRSVMMRRDKSAAAILGAIDAVKLRSSMTLFEAAARAIGRDGHAPFGECLALFFDGERDAATLQRL